MAKVRTPFFGLDANHITVGKGKGHNYADPQEAWNDISDAASDNPYLIDCTSPGEWTGGATTYGNSEGEPMFLFSNKTDIAIVGGPATVWRRTTSGIPEGGGCVGIGRDGETTERIRLVDLVIYNSLSGDSGTGGGEAPEGGLYIGEEAVYGTTLPFDDVYVVNCEIGGVHDALQCFGTAAPDDGGPARPPRIFVMQNRLFACHDAYTVKGNMQLQSNGNTIHVRSAGVSPWLTTVNDWKHTGIHYNMAEGITTATDRGAQQFSQHNNEQIFVHSTANTGASKTGQDLVAGILFYFDSGVAYAADFSNCQIRVLFDENYSPSRGVAGILKRQSSDVADGLVNFDSCRITVDQVNTGGSAPSEVAGVLMGDAPSAAATFAVTNSTIAVTNAAGGGSAYALQTSAAGNDLKHGGVVSAQAEDASGGGTITHVPPLT